MQAGMKETKNSKLDELVKSGRGADELMAEGEVLKELFKRVAERALDAEMTTHLGYGRHDPAGLGSGNARNGRSRKTALATQGAVQIES